MRHGRLSDSGGALRGVHAVSVLRCIRVLSFLVDRVCTFINRFYDYDAFWTTRTRAGTRVED